MLGYEALRDDTGADSMAYRRPVPMLSEGRKLAPLVNAMMDVSDGLLLDCWRLASASDVCIRLESGAILVADPDRFDECVRWGDDYALLFTLPAGVKPPVPAMRIGYIGPDSFAPLWLDDLVLTPADGLGYQHGG